MFLGIDHSAIAVSDSARSIAFYEALGLRVAARALNSGHEQARLDGVGIRLPTICVRPGKPNKAASGFFSGIIREPLAGLEAVLPVADTLVLCQHVDAALFSVLRDVSQVPKIEAAYQRIAALGVPTLGAVVLGIEVSIAQRYGV